MEICGGQTHTLMRYGIDELFPPQIELVHGPGCPVCVTPLEIIDKAIRIASRPDVTFVSYGDMLRVPGSRLGPAPREGGGRRRARGLLADGGAEDRARASRSASGVSSASDLRPPLRPTPWPSGRRSAKGLRNFSMLVSHVLVPPAIRLLLLLAAATACRDSSPPATSAR